MNKGFLIIIFCLVLIISIGGFSMINKEKNNNTDNTIKQSDNITSNENTLIEEPKDNIQNDKNNVNENKRSVENVKMIIKDGTLTSSKATIIITDKNQKPFIYNEWYRIEKRENEEWKEVSIINSNHSFISIAYNIDNTGKIEKNVDWSELYGSLEKGVYRLVKNVYDDEGEEIFFSVEFEIVE